MTPQARAAVAAAWAFRHRVELEAQQRFERLSTLLPLPFAQDALNASVDERRHAQLCEALARELGATALATHAQAERIAPARLSVQEALLYEVVAACCITETESVGVLTSLLAAERATLTERVEPVLREIARDEVRHSRLGWAYLAHARAQGEVAFLGQLVPTMLAGSISPDLFDEPGRDEPDPLELLAHGVLPRAAKRAVFVSSVREVILPGLLHLGVPDGPARRWLESKTGS